MAEFRWRGNGAGTKTAINDGRNYVDGAGNAYAQTRYPGSLTGVNDDLLFDAALAEGAQPPAGYDCTALVPLRSLSVSSNYNSTIASAAAWLKVAAQTVIIDASSAGDIYINGVGDGLDNVTVLNATGLYFDGNCTPVYVYNGIVDFAASSTVGDSLTIGASSSSQASVTLNAGMTLPTTIFMNGGSVTNYNAVTTLQIANGTWTQVSGDLTTVRTNAGTLYWNDGNITTAYIYGGSVNGSNSATPRRVNAIYLYPNGTLELDNGVGSIYVTDRIYHMDGTLSVAPGTQIQQYATKTYAGADNAKFGIAPQTINNTTVAGDGVYLSETDRLDCYCIAGAIAPGAVLSFAAYEDDASDFSGEAAVSGKAAALLDDEDNQVALIQIWGYELTAGKPFVRVKAIEAGSQNALVAVQYVKHEM
jgi:hypothetical protein